MDESDHGRLGTRLPKRDLVRWTRAQLVHCKSAKIGRGLFRFEPIACQGLQARGT